MSRMFFETQCSIITQVQGSGVARNFNWGARLSSLPFPLYRFLSFCPPLFFPFFFRSRTPKTS